MSGRQVDAKLRKLRNCLLRLYRDKCSIESAGDPLESVALLDNSKPRHLNNLIMVTSLPFRCNYKERCKMFKEAVSKCGFSVVTINENYDKDNLHYQNVQLLHRSAIKKINTNENN